MTQLTDIVQYLNPRDVRGETHSPAERRILRQVNQKVAAAEDLDATLSYLHEATRGVCPCDRVAVALLEADDRRVISRSVHADYQPILLGEGYAEDYHGSTLERIITEGQVRIINDLEAYLKLRPDSRSTRLIVREGVRSSMTCPLTVDGRRVGLLFRSSRRPGTYTNHAVSVYQALAERLSQAVEKAWRIAQLETTYIAYMEMLGFISHELKSPVGSLMMDAEYLLGGYDGQLSDTQARRLRRMVEKGKYLLNLVREYIDLSRIEGGRLELNPTPGVNLLADVVEPAIDILSTQIDQREVWVTREVPKTLRLDGDPELLKVVMVNLIGNAIKYGREDGEIRISAQQQDEAVRVAVWNEGVGFTSAQRHQLFQRFSRLDTPELKKQKGTGVGLYTVWRIVQLHGGRVDAQSQPGEWTEFFFTIPQPLPESGD